jgi:hypothetical protein
MKKFLLSLFIAATICSASKSQTLYNTTWSMYDPADQFAFYFHFSTDTLSFSLDNISYTPVSNFLVGANNFTIFDVNGLTCPLTDTGHSTFTIINDTLRFTLVSDPCPDRALVLGSYYGVLLITGIETPTVTPSISVSPNPSPGGIFNITIPADGETFNNILLVTPDGKIVFEKPISERISSPHTVDLSKEPRGIYFLKLQGGKGSRVFRLLR